MLNEVLFIPKEKARISDRNIRLHLPAPLSNPFQMNERVSRADVVLAYEAWLRNKLIIGDRLITAEMERIAGLISDGTGKPVGLIGPEEEGRIIHSIIKEALNQ